MNKYDKDWVYKLKCPTCHKKCIGQTGRPFRVRFRDPFNDYKYANNSSNFAQLVIDEGRTFGPINDVVDTIHTANKGIMLDTLEKFYIYKETQSGNQLSDKLTVQKNWNTNLTYLLQRATLSQAVKTRSNTNETVIHTSSMSKESSGFISVTEINHKQAAIARCTVQWTQFSAQRMDIYIKD